MDDLPVHGSWHRSSSSSIYVQNLVFDERRHVFIWTGTPSLSTRGLGGKVPTYVSGTEYRIVIRHKFTIALDQHTVVSGDHTVVSTLCNVRCNVYLRALPLRATGR